jgi:hypothetical protein
MSERAHNMFNGFVNPQKIGMIASIPTRALFEAQTQANMDYVKYLREVMFDKDGNLIMVEFKYQEVVGTEVIFRRILVPLIAIITHPCIGVEEATVDYNIRVHDEQSETSSVGTQSEVSGGGSVGGSFWGVSFSAHWGFKFSVTTKDERKRSTDTTADFKMHIRITRLPPSEGMGKVLDALLKGGGGAAGGGDN